MKLVELRGSTGGALSFGAGLARIEAMQQLLQAPRKFLICDMIVGVMEPIGHCALQFPPKLVASDLLQKVHGNQCAKAYRRSWNSEFFRALLARYFRLPQPTPLAQITTTFQVTAPKYQGIPGLLRKNYFISEDGQRAGGIYVWESRADADRVYTPEWKAIVQDKYGAPPSIEYLQSSDDQSARRRCQQRRYDQGR